MNISNNNTSNIHLTKKVHNTNLQLNSQVSRGKSKEKDDISLVESALRRKYFDPNNYNYRDMQKDVEEDIIKKERQENIDLFNKKIIDM